MGKFHCRLHRTQVKTTYTLKLISLSFSECQYHPCRNSPPCGNEGLFCDQRLYVTESVINTLPMSWFSLLSVSAHPLIQLASCAETCLSASRFTSNWNSAISILQIYPLNSISVTLDSDCMRFCVFMKALCLPAMTYSTSSPLNALVLVKIQPTSMSTQSHLQYVEMTLKG